MLDIRELVCSYGKVVALKGLSLSVQSGQLVSLIGANGAGKTTTLRAISGLLKPTSGYILFNGNDITYAPTRKVLSLGIACCPEGRRVFPYLTVRENLEMGCYLRSDRTGIASDMERIFSDFPVLAERAGQAAGTLSGGEQQMLAIGRALMSRPALILLMSLRSVLPQTSWNVPSRSFRASARGDDRLMVEQNALAALGMCDYAYVLESGKVVLEGTGKELLSNPNVRQAYLGG